MLFDPSAITAEMFDDCYALHFCSVSLGDFPMKDAHRAAITIARRQGAIVSFDPNLRFMLWDDKDALKRVIWEFIPDCDIVKISDEELEPCAIIGARLYFVACNLDYYTKHPKAIFDLRSGGLAIYGGVILVFIGGLVMCYIRKIPFRELADYCVVYLPLGQAIGRWGNFFNQECFGTNTTLPWGMTSSTIESYLSSSCARQHS